MISNTIKHEFLPFAVGFVSGGVSASNASFVVLVMAVWLGWRMERETFLAVSCLLLAMYASLLGGFELWQKKASRKPTKESKADKRAALVEDCFWRGFLWGHFILFAIVLWLVSDYVRDYVHLNVHLAHLACNAARLVRGEIELKNRTEGPAEQQLIPVSLV